MESMTFEQRLALRTLNGLFTQSALAIIPLNGVTIVTLSVADDAFLLIQERLEEIMRAQRLLYFGTTERKPGLLGEVKFYARLRWFVPLPEGFSSSEFVQLKRRLGAAHRGNRRVDDGRLPNALSLVERQEIRNQMENDLREMFFSNEPGEASKGMLIWVVEKRPDLRDDVTRVATLLKASIPPTYSPWPAQESRRHLIREIRGRLVVSTLRFVPNDFTPDPQWYSADL